MNTLKKDLTHTAGLLQVSAGQKTGAEAIVRAIYGICNDKHSKTVLLVDV